MVFDPTKFPRLSIFENLEEEDEKLGQGGYTTLPLASLAPSTVDPLEESLTFAQPPISAPTLIGGKTIEEINKEAVAGLQKVSNRITEFEKEKEVKAALIPTDNEYDKETVNRYSSALVAVDNFGKISKDEQESISKNQSHQVLENMIHSIRSMSDDPEMADNTERLLRAVHNVFTAEGNNVMIATPNGRLVTPYEIFSDITLRPSSFHREHKTDYFYVLTDSKVREQLLSKMKEGSAAHEIVKVAHEAITYSEENGEDLGDRNYYNAQERVNNIIVNLVPYGLQAVKAAGAAAGIGGIAKFAGASKIAAVGLGAAASIVTLGAVALSMAAYYAYQMRENNRLTTEYFTLLKGVDEGKYSFAQISRAMDRAILPEYVLRDGSIDTNKLKTASAQGIETSMDISFFPTYNLHQNLGKGNVLFNQPRMFEYDTYSQQGDLMGEVIGTLAVTMPLLHFNVGKLAAKQGVKSLFKNKFAHSLGYATAFTHSVMTQFAFDYVQGHSMEYLMNTETFSNLIQLNREMAIGVLSVPFLQQIPNTFIRLGTHSLANRAFQGATKLVALSKMSNEMADAYRVLNFSAKNAFLGQGAEEASDLLARTNKQQLSINNWADALMFGSDSERLLKLTPETLRKYSRDFEVARQFVNEELVVSRSTINNAFKSTRDVNTSSDEVARSVKAIGTLRQMVVDARGEEFAEKFIPKDLDNVSETKVVEISDKITRLLNLAMNDESIIDSNIVKYKDGDAVKLSLLRTVEIPDFDGTSMLRLKIDLDDMKALYESFYGNVEVNEKIRSRINILSGFQDEINRVLLGDIEITSKQNLDRAVNDSASFLKSMVESKSISLESIEAMRQDFKNENSSYSKVVALKGILSGADFEQVLKTASSSALYGESSGMFTRSLFPIISKLTNIFSSLGSDDSTKVTLIANFHSKNRANKVSITAGVLSDLRERFKQAFSDHDKNVTQADTEVLVNNFKLILDRAITDLKDYYKNTPEKSTHELEVLTNLKKQLDAATTEAEIKSVDDSIKNMAQLVGDPDAYKGLVEDLIKFYGIVEEGSKDITGLLNPEVISNRIFSLIDNPDDLKLVLTKLDQIRESGFGGLISRLAFLEETFMTANKDDSIKILNYVNTRGILGLEDGTISIKLARAKGLSKLRSLAESIIAPEETQDKKSVKQGKGSTDKNLKLDHESLVRSLEKAATAKRLSYQLFISLQNTRSFITGPSQKSIASAVFELSQAMSMKESATTKEDKVAAAERSLRYALANSGYLPTEVLSAVETLASRLNVLMQGSTKIAENIIDLLRGHALDIKNPVLKQIVESDEGVFLRDLAYLAGIVDRNTSEGASFLKNIRDMFVVEREDGDVGFILRSISDNLSKLSRNIEDMASGEITLENWTIRNEAFKQVLGEVWSAVVGRAEWEKISKAFDELNLKHTTSEATGKTSAIQVLDYEKILKMVYTDLRHGFTNNAPTELKAGDLNSLFNDKQKAVFSRKFNPNATSLASTVRSAGAFQTLYQQIMSPITALIRDVEVKNEDSLLRAYQLFEKLNPENLDKVRGVLQNKELDITQKFDLLQAEMERAVYKTLEKSVMLDSLSSLGFGGIKDEKFTFLDTVKQVSDRTRTTPGNAILPHLARIVGMIDNLRTFGMNMDKLSNPESIKMHLEQLEAGFREFKEVIKNFKDSKILNLLPEDIQMQLYNAIDGSMTKAESMIANFSRKYNQTTTTDATRELMRQNAGDYFRATFGWAEFLNRVLRNFNDQLDAMAERQNYMLFNDNIVDAMRRAFGTINRTAISTIATISAEQEMKLVEPTFLNKLNNQVKQVWDAISRSTVYNTALNRTLFDPYYGLSPDFVSGFRKFQIEKNDIAAMIGTVVHKIGLDPKKPETIREFGRNTSKLLALNSETGELDGRMAAAFNASFGTEEFRLQPGLSDPNSIRKAKEIIVTRILGSGLSTSVSTEPTAVAKNLVAHLEVFEKNGILDLVLEHSAEYFSGKDKINSFDIRPDMKAERDKMLQTWNTKLINKIKSSGKDPTIVMAQIKQDIRDKIGPNASLEDALVFNALLVSDFTGNLLLSAALDESLFKYVGATLPSLYNGVIQIRNLVDYVNILGVKFGETGLDDIANFDRRNVLVSMFGTDDDNMDRVVRNPINVRSQEFYLRSSLQQTMLEFEKKLYEILTPDNLITDDATLDSFKQTNRYIVTLDQITTIDKKQSSNIYIQFDLDGAEVSPAVLSTAIRAVFGDTAAENFVYIKSGIVDPKNKHVSSGMHITPTKNGINITLGNDGKISSSAHGKTQAEVIKDVFQADDGSKMIVAIRTKDMKNMLLSIASEMSGSYSFAELASGIYSQFKDSGTSSQMRQYIQSLAASEGASELEKSFVTQFNRMLANRVATETDDSGAKNFVIKSDDISILIPKSSAQIISRRPTSTDLGDASNVVKGEVASKEIGRESIQPETIHGGVKRSDVEYKVILDINQKLWGLDGEVPTTIAELKAMYETNKDMLTSKKSNTKTITIDGVKFDGVTRVLGWDEYVRQPDASESVKNLKSRKPDIVIETNNKVYLISHKATNAEAIEGSSQAVMRNELVNNAVIQAITKYFQDALEANKAQYGTPYEFIARHGISVSDLFEFSRIEQLLKGFTQDIDGLSKAFGHIITAQDMGMDGKFAAPFSQDGIKIFLQNLTSAIELVGKSNEDYRTKSLKDLFMDNTFKEAVIRTLMTETSQWLMGYNKMIQAGNEGAFYKATEAFLSKAFLKEGDFSGKSKAKVKQNDTVGMLRAISDITDPDTTKVEGKKSKTIELEDAISNLIEDSYSHQRSTIGNMDKSLIQLLALKPDPFKTLQDNMTKMIQNIQLGTFVTKMMFDTGAIKFLGMDGERASLSRAQEDEANGLIKVMSLQDVQSEFRHVYPEFIKLMLKSEELQNEIVQAVFAKFDSVSPGGDLKTKALSQYYSVVKDLRSEKVGALGSLKFAISTELYDQLAFLNNKLTPTKTGNTFGAKVLDTMNALMTYFTTNFSGAVLIWNHVSWMRNIMGAFLQASLSTGDIFTGMEYTLRALKDIAAYEANKPSESYARYLSMNKPSPLSMARAGIIPHTLDMGSFDRERHAAFRVAHGVLNKPMEIINTGLYKALGAITQKDPTSLEARMRSLYGQVDNMNRYALWLMAKDGKVRAPENYSSLAKLISKDFALQRAIQKAFSSDIVDSVAANGRFLAKMSDADASAFARKFSFVYDELPPVWKMVKSFWNPFASFTYNSYRILHNSMTTYPARVAGLYMGLSIMNNALLKDTFGIDVSLNSFIPNMDVFSWLFGDTDNMDFLNISNPSAPFIRFARTIMEQRDPFTKQDMSSFGAAELWLRSYINAFLPVAPTANFAARTALSVGKRFMGIEDSPYAERGKLGLLYSLLPESYLHKKAIEEGLMGRPVDKFGTVVNPLAGALYGLFGLNVRPTDRLKSMMIIDEFERVDKSLETQIENLYEQPLLETNRNIQMEIRALEKRREANARRSIDAFHDVFGEVPEYIKENYLYNHPLGPVEAVKDYITESWRNLLSGIFEGYGRSADLSVLRR